MRIREGFVTNSSSSSFIVKIPLSIDSVNFDIKDEDSLRQYFIDGYGDGTFEEMMEEDCYKREYDSLKQMLDSGTGIVTGRIEYGGENDFAWFVKKLGFDVEWSD